MSHQDAHAKPRRPSGRPSQPIVSRRAAIEAAVKIIDDDGLQALSVRSLGRALGVSSSSLYHHFSDKREILIEVVQYILRDVPIARRGERDGPDLPWQQYVIGPTIAMRKAFLAHPNAAPLLLTRPKQAFAHDVVDSSIRAVADAGVPANVQLTMFRAAEMVAVASAILDDHSERNRGYGDVAPKYEALRAAIQSDESTPDESFELILHALLTGFSVLVAMDEPASSYSSKPGGAPEGDQADRESS
jgi:TetR/AcrR family tetracycline transcriptional repressor